MPSGPYALCTANCGGFVFIPLPVGVLSILNSPLQFPLDRVNPRPTPVLSPESPLLPIVEGFNVLCNPGFVVVVEDCNRHPQLGTTLKPQLYKVLQDSYIFWSRVAKGAGIGFSFHVVMSTLHEKLRCVSPRKSYHQCSILPAKSSLMEWSCQAK